MQNYSQNQEQEVILNYFQNKPSGKFLEIGAFDAFKFSNTRALYENGFSGVMIEPSPNCFNRLQSVYGNDERIKLLNCAIAKEDGTITFYETGGDAIGTTDISHKDKWERGAGVQYTPIVVKAMSMTNLLNEHGNDVDFLSLDTEGTNFELFNLLSDSFLTRLNLICIEHDNKQNEIMAKLASFGFKQLHLNGENLIAGK